MATGIPAIDSAISRLRQADLKAVASALAFQLGPDVFTAHIEKTNLADIEEIYRELGYDNATTNNGPSSGGGPAGNPSSGGGSGPGAAPAHAP